MFYPSVSRLLRRFVLVWTADKQGNAHGEFVPPLTAKLLRVLVFSGSNSERPCDGYDVALLDRSGVDALAGTGRGLDGCVMTELTPVEQFAHDPLELKVSGAGPGASGRVVLFVREQVTSA